MEQEQSQEDPLVLIRPPPPLIHVKISYLILVGKYSFCIIFILYTVVNKFYYPNMKKSFRFRFLLFRLSKVYPMLLRRVYDFSLVFNV